MGEVINYQTPIYTPYRMNEANEIIPLYRGPLEIEQVGVNASGYGTVELRWLPEPGIAFVLEVERMDEWCLFGDNRTTVKIPEPHNLPFECVDMPEVEFSGGRCLAGTDDDGVEVGDGKDLKQVVFHLVNFHHTFGETLTDESGVWGGRTTLEFDDWKLTIDQVSNFKSLEESARRTRGYAVTHNAKLERIDGQTFSSPETLALVTELVWFFSFARGAFCSPILLVGLNDEGDRVWEHWRVYRTTPSETKRSWFVFSKPQTLQYLLRGYLRLFRQPSWTSPLCTAINWYISSNSNEGQLEGAIILSQVTLELLSWVYFVEAGQLSESGFSNLPAVDRIRLIVSHLGISLGIPDHLADLKLLSKEINWSDGAQAITEMRNAFVHPSPKSRSKASRYSFQAMSQTHDIALAYIELIMLSLFDYRDIYVNRLSPIRIQGRNVEKVPWAKP